jgi:hypothetical protein
MKNSEELQWHEWGCAICLLLLELLTAIFIISFFVYILLYPIFLLGIADVVYIQIGNLLNYMVIFIVLIGILALGFAILDSVS